MKLSPTMEEVLAKLREHRAPLVRWPGGFWSYRGCAPTKNAEGRTIPSWWTTAHTVRALEDRGLLRRCNRFPEPWRDHRELTETTKGEK